jgi:hypothetical protein
VVVVLALLLPQGNAGITVGEPGDDPGRVKKPRVSQPQRHQEASLQVLFKGDSRHVLNDVPQKEVVGVAVSVTLSGLVQEVAGHVGADQVLRGEVLAKEARAPLLPLLRCGPPIPHVAREPGGLTEEVIDGDTVSGVGPVGWEVPGRRVLQPQPSLRHQLQDHDSGELLASGTDVETGLRGVGDLPLTTGQAEPSLEEDLVPLSNKDRAMEPAYFMPALYVGFDLGFTAKSGAGSWGPGRKAREIAIVMAGLKPFAGTPQGF